MAVDIFQNNTKGIPKSDPQIVRVSMQELEIGGRKSNLPATSKAGDMTIRHVGTSK